MWRRSLSALKPKSAEQLFTARVQQHVAANDAPAAMAAVRAAIAEQAVVPPGAAGAALHAGEKHGRHAEALALARQLDTVPGFKWNEQVSTLVARLCAHTGDVDGAVAAVKWTAGKGLLRRRSVAALLDMCAARDDLEGLAENAWQLAQHHALEMADTDFGSMLHVKRARPEQQAQLLGQVHATVGALTPQGAPRVLEALRSGGWTTDGAAVSDAGVCSCCGATLRGFGFDAAYREQLLCDITTKLIPAQKNPRVVRGFETFRRYVEGARMDVIVDGANVGYYGLSSWFAAAKPTAGAEVPESAKALKQQPVRLSPDYTLIDTLMRQLRDAGQRPLLLLHERHVERKNVPAEHWATVERWMRDRVMYATPAGVNDDLFWLYGAVFHSTTAQPGSRSGGGKGTAGHDVTVITNDRMRDHHFAMLSARSFLRWRERHRIGFHVVRDHEKGVSRVVLEPPPPFSTVTQGADAAWHVPVVHEPPATTPADKADDGDGAPAETDAPAPVVSWHCVRWRKA